MKKITLLILLITTVLQAQVTDFVIGLDSPTRLIIDNDVIYVKGTSLPGEIIEIDLANSTPSSNVLFTTSALFEIGGFIKQGNTVYFANVNSDTGESSLLSFDVSTPTVTNTIASGLGYVAALGLYGDELYFTDEDLSLELTSLKKVDITISNPSVNTVLTGLTNPQDMEFNGNTLYIGDRDAGGGIGIIYAVDVTLTTPILTSFITNVNVRGVYIFNNYLYFSDAGVIKKAPFSNASNISTVATDTGTSSDFLRDVVISGTTLYMPQENLGKIVTKTYNVGVTDVIDPIDSGATGFDIAGNELYFASGSGTISKIDVSATTPSITTVLSGLNEPEGVLLNGNDLYFSQTGDNKICKIDITASTPTIIDVVTGLNEPTYLALSGNDLYISEIGGNKVSKIDITTTLPATATDVVTGLNLPLGLEINGNDLYIVEVDANKVSKIDVTATLPTTATDVVTGLTKPLLLELNGNDLYITETNANKVSKIDITATLPTTATDVITELGSSGSLVSDGNYLYFSDSSSSGLSGEGKISKYSLSTLSVDDNSISEKFNVFPNPATNYILVPNTISVEDYAIFNVLGKKIKNTSLESDNKIDISNLASGVYIILVNNSFPIRFVKK